MQYFEISYYRSYNWIDKKYVKSEIGATAAIRKTKLKNIVDCVEITEEQYNEYRRIQKERKEDMEAARKAGFIQFFSRWDEWCKQHQK
jgi:cytochrome c oxidase assembly factor CtaG